MGVVSDDKLNELYNRSYFVFLPSKIEGIGLSMIEGIICDCVPITCEDNLTAMEFIPELAIEANIRSIVSAITRHWNSKPMDLINKYKEDFKIRFHKKTVAQNILNVYNNL